MNDYWKMMTGSGAKHKKKPEESRELSRPVEVTPEVMGPVHEPNQEARLPKTLDEMSALDSRQMRRLSEAAQTGETTIEMRECVARTDGKIKARSVEVSISYGDRLSLGDLFRGCLSIMDYSRRGFGRHSVALPPPHVIDGQAELSDLRARLEREGQAGALGGGFGSVEPLDSPFRKLEQKPLKGLGYHKKA